MIIVADTGPINYLVQLDLAYLLHKLYGTLLLPPEVLRELMQPSAPFSVRHWASNFPSWVRVQAPVNLRHAELLGPDDGERAAITLSIETAGATVLQDERKARQIAETLLQLPVIGTLGIVRDAHSLGIIDGANAFRKLCAITGFYHHPTLDKTFLDSLNL